VSTGREWTVAKLESSARLRGFDPVGRLLALFDVLDDVTNRADREARSFVTVLAGSGLQLDLTRAITRLAAETGLRDVEEVVLSLRLLITGALNSVLAGDLNSPRRARSMASTLVGLHREASAQQEPIAQAQPLLDIDHELDSYLDWEV
jgi:hypothetical protein